MLAVRDVTVREGSRTLVDRVSFDAESGEIVAVVGPNGSGKTTLLEAIAGLRRAESASVTLDGSPVSAFPERARAFAFLPDRGELAPELRVRTHVDHALRHRARPSSLVEDLRGVFGIGALLDQPAGALSRGERQSVALFCALAIDRPVVILDEPFGVFDPFRLRRVLAVVRRLAASGASIVAAVHQLGDAEKLADRVVLVCEGRRVACGTPAALRDQAGLGTGSLEDVFLALLEQAAHAS